MSGETQAGIRKYVKKREAIAIPVSACSALEKIFLLRLVAQVRKLVYNDLSQLVYMISTSAT